MGGGCVKSESSRLGRGRRFVVQTGSAAGSREIKTD